MAGILHRLLSASAERAPERLLAQDAKHQLSYGEAEHAAGAVARGLRQRGVRRGDRVALLLPDRPEFITGYYGVLKAGAVVVPMSPDARATSLCKLLARCGARAIITTGKNSKLLQGRAAELPALSLMVCVDRPRIESEAQLSVIPWADLIAVDDPLDEDCAEADLASIMFTSGTTAEPKGVMISHGSLVASTRSIVEYLELQPDEKMAMVLPFFYSYGLSVLHTHIAVGGTLCGVGSVAFPAAVLRGVQTFKCTGMSGVPSSFARLVGSTAIGTFDCSSLRTLTQAGGPMTPALTEKVVAAFPRARLFVMYGQTEAAPRLSYLPPDKLMSKLGSVGKAIPGVTLKVLDGEGKVARPGEVGELVAQGPNIMMGYWNDPEETARVLRPEGLRTGDLAYVDEDGFFYIRGRKTDMIKAGAHRVGPKEIEQVIETLDEVAQAAVVGVPDELDGEAIAAYVVKRADAELDEKAIRRVCFDNLPRFKIPAHVRVVEDLPRTPSGKLRRSELKGWFAAEREAG